MKKVLAVGVIVLFIGMTISSSTGFNLEKQSTVTTLDGNTLYVGGSGPGNYTSIQEAIDDAEDGDTVFVYDDSSPYFENINIEEKTINLIGEDTNTTIIDAGGGSSEFAWVIATTDTNNLTVQNLTLQNCTSIYGTNYAFVSQHSDNMKIINCRIRDSIHGMRLQYCANTYMRNNRFENNSMNFGLSGWQYHFDFINDIDSSNTINGKPMYNLVNESDVVLDGIDIGWLGLIYCKNITVKNINFSEPNIQDILLINTRNSIISNCETYGSENTQHSIDIGFYSDNNIIEDCPNLDGLHFITNDGFGPDNNIVRNCNFTFGIGFQQAFYNHIENCKIDIKNKKSGVWGNIRFSESNYNTISNCTIVYSGGYKIGISIQEIVTPEWDLGSHYNNIINNTFYDFPYSAIFINFWGAYNRIIGNRIINCCNENSGGSGIYITNNRENDNNIIYHNSFIDNYRNAYDARFNIWNSSYPYGGNYWDSYNNDDIYRGPNQDILGNDGILDLPNNIPPRDNKDWYPLMYPMGENPPVADHSYEVNNYTLLLDASSSFDRDGNVVSYDWDFGDGTSDTGMIVSHTFSEDEIFKVTLIVTDDDDNLGNWSQLIRIGNLSPEAPTIEGETNGKAFMSHFYNFTSEDPKGEDVSYYIEWGDGKITSWSDFIPSGETYRTSHGWGKGTFIIRAKAKNIYGEESDWGTLEVTMPKNQNIWYQIWLDRHPILQRILEFLGCI